MMALFFSHFADAVGEGQRRFEVGELVGARDVVLVDDPPLSRFGQLRMNLCEISALERGHASAAGNAGFVGKGRHRSFRLQEYRSRSTGARRAMAPASHTLGKINPVRTEYPHP